MSSVISASRCCRRRMSPGTTFAGAWSMLRQPRPHTTQRPEMNDVVSVVRFCLQRHTAALNSQDEGPSG